MTFLFACGLSTLEWWWMLHSMTSTAGDYCLLLISVFLYLHIWVLGCIDAEIMLCPYKYLTFLTLLWSPTSTSCRPIVSHCLLCHNQVLWHASHCAVVFICYGLPQNNGALCLLFYFDTIILILCLS